MWVGRHFLLSRSQARQSAPPAGARSAALPLLAAAVLGAGLLLVLTGCARVSRPAAAVEKLTEQNYEDDEPSLAAHRDGSLSVAWVAYRNVRIKPL
mgnify:CR=1 FL=1